MAIAFRLCLLNLPRAIKKNDLSKSFKKLASLAYFLTDVGKWSILILIKSYSRESAEKTENSFIDVLFDKEKEKIFKSSEETRKEKYFPYCVR